MESLISHFQLPSVIVLAIAVYLFVRDILKDVKASKDTIEDGKKKKKQKYQEEVSKEQQFNDLITQVNDLEERFNTNTENIHACLNKINDTLELLINSDKDDIKAYITEKHHFFCYQLGWIDDYSLDCLERRYSNYLKENGNSFVKGLMEDLRQLPKNSPIAYGNDKQQ